MATDVKIKPKLFNSKPIDVLSLAKLSNLSYGIMNGNYVLEFDKTGKNTVLYNSERIGRGFDITIDKDIELIMPLPNTPSDIKLFYNFISKICEYLEVKKFKRNGLSANINELDNYIKEDIEASKSSLDSFENKALINKSDFTIFGAYNPITLGEEEYLEIDGSLEKFEEVLDRLQKWDVYYANLRLFQRKDDSIFGLYIIGEEIDSVLPLTPLCFRNDLNVDGYYVSIPGPNVISYHDFINNVEGIKYDSKSIVISLDERKINYLAKHFATNVDTDAKVEPKLYNSKVVLDRGYYHSSKCKDLKLDIDEIVGYNHLAVFVRWAYEEGMINEEVYESEKSFKEYLDNDKDLRKLIKDSEYFNGEIRLGYFKDEIKDFVRYFYRYEEQKYPYCVDLNAENYFGEEYNNPKYQDEAYLFVPYNEMYYKNLSKYIIDAYKVYKENVDEN